MWPDDDLVEEGDPMTPEVLRAWCADRNITVWAITEGMGANDGPLMCCPGPDALTFTDAMSAARCFAQVDLLPCCQNEPDEEGELACIRDTFDDQPEAVMVVLRTTAAAHGIAWPDDIAGPQT